MDDGFATGGDSGIYRRCFSPVPMSGRGLTSVFLVCYISHAVTALHLTTIKGGPPMNKSDLIDAIAKKAVLSKADASRALDAAITAVQGSLKKSGKVTLVGFGTFSVGKRGARTGRNPQTGATIKIKASKVVRFRAGKALKDSIK